MHKVKWRPPGCSFRNQFIVYNIFSVLFLSLSKPFGGTNWLSENSRISVFSFWILCFFSVFCCFEDSFKEIPVSSIFLMGCVWNLERTDWLVNLLNRPVGVFIVKLPWNDIFLQYFKASRMEMDMLWPQHSGYRGFLGCQQFWQRCLVVVAKELGVLESFLRFLGLATHPKQTYDLDPNQPPQPYIMKDFRSSWTNIHHSHEFWRTWTWSIAFQGEDKWR